MGFSRLRTITEPTPSGVPSSRTTLSRIQYLPGVAPNIASGTVKYRIPTKVSQGHATAVVVEYMPPLAVMKPEVTSVPP